jgi:hypothetical protein
VCRSNADRSGSRRYQQEAYVAAFVGHSCVLLLGLTVVVLDGPTDRHSGRKITESLGNVTVRGEKGGKSKGGSRWPTVSLSMYSITENIYYSQLSSVAILLQPEPVFTSYSTRKDWVLSPNELSPCGLPLPPTCLLVTANEARSYFESTIGGQIHTILT